MKRQPILVEIWRFRGLIRSLTLRDVKVKYQRSLLGLVWTLLNPLLTIAILVSVFTYVIRIQIVHYWAFLVSGFFAWNYLQRALYHSTTVLRENAPLSRSVYFPPEVLILSTSLSKLSEFLVEMSIVVVALAVFHHGFVPPSFLLLPLIVLLLVLLSVGIMLPLAVVSVFYYDVQHAVPIAVTSLFYISPVFYPVGMIPEAAQPYYRLNPVVGALELFHKVLYEGGWPSAHQLGSAAATALAVCVLGHLIFRKYKGVCVEIA